MGVKGIAAACALTIAALGVGGCSSGGSGSSDGGCTTWRVSQDGAVVASEYSATACDTGPLLTPNAGTLTLVSSAPAHGGQVCDVPVENGVGWKIYAGRGGDPDGEAQGVCEMFGQ